LAGAVLKALKDEPELVLIISDGYENEPSGLTSQLIDIYKKKVDTEDRVKIFHINPVFAAEAETTKKLGENIPVAGLRDVKQLQTTYFLLRAREDVMKAIEELKTYLLGKKREIKFGQLKNYLLPEPKK